MSAYSQSLNNTTIDEKSGKTILIDEFDYKILSSDTTYSWWFNSNYDMYEVQDSLVKDLDLSDIKIVVILGTWCGDSREQFPRFIKVLEKTNFPFSNLKTFAVDRKKKGLELNFDEYNIERVPTFYFYKNGKEIGRIIETPKETLEKDLFNIVTSQK